MHNEDDITFRGNTILANHCSMLGKDESKHGFWPKLIKRVEMLVTYQI